MLELEGIALRLGEFSLRQVDLRVGEGQYFCLAGPTGAGKTILLECIAGLHRPDRGLIRMHGRDVTALPPEARNIGYVPQDYALFPHMSVFENIAYGLRERGARGEKLIQRVRAAAETMRIAHLLGRGIENLSGGERQRTAFARALVLNCELLLLDESLSALDVVTRKELGLQLADLHRQLGLTVIHVTHDFDEAFNLATHIGICNAGRLLQVDTIEQAFTQPNCRTVAEFLGIVNVFPRRGTSARSCPVIGRLHHALGRTLDGHCVCIRPDQIALSRKAPPPSALSFRGVVRQLRWLGPIYEVILDIGTPLVVTVSRQERADLNLQAGDAVSAVIEPAALHIMHDG